MNKLCWLLSPLNFIIHAAQNAPHILLRGETRASLLTLKHWTGYQGFPSINTPV